MKQNDPHQKNCEKLQEMSSNLEIKQSYQNLHSKVTSNSNFTREFGYSFELNVQPQELNLANNNSISLNVPTGVGIFGASHTHPYEYPNGAKVFPMFSIFDIYKLAELRFRNSDLAYDDSLFVFTLTVKQGNSSETFALKINDWSKMLVFANKFYSSSSEKRIDWKEKLDEEYEAVLAGNGGNITSNYIKAMFKFMHDEDINGIDVYKATDANLSNWQRLNYDAENNIMLNPTDCNN